MKFNLKLLLSTIVLSISILLSACSDPPNPTPEPAATEETKSEAATEGSPTEEPVSEETSSEEGAEGAEGEAGEEDAAMAASEQYESFEINVEEFYPTGMARHNETLFVAGLQESSIVAINTTSGEASTFIKSETNGLMTPFGLLADSANNLLYVCSSQMGIREFPGSVPAVMSFDVESGEARARYDLPDGGWCGMLAQASDGTIYVTDNESPRILRLQPGAEALDVWFEDESLRAEETTVLGLVLTDDKTMYVNIDEGGHLFELSLDQEGNVAQLSKIQLEHIENMYGMHSLGDDKLLVVTDKLLELTIQDGKGESSIVAEGFNDPSDVEVVAGVAYVSESQLLHLFIPEDLGPPQLPFRIYQVPLEQ